MTSFQTFLIIAAAGILTAIVIVWIIAILTEQADADAYDNERAADEGAWLHGLDRPGFDHPGLDPLGLDQREDYDRG
jgi:hypothetical protein